MNLIPVSSLFLVTYSHTFILPRSLGLFIGVLAVGAVVLGLNAAAWVYMARRRGTGGAFCILWLRLLMMGALAWLVWKAFWDYEKIEEATEDKPNKRHLIVLQDLSDSMRFKAGDISRATLADRVWQQVQKQAANHPAKPKLSRFYFAGNVVGEKDRQRLRTDSTQTAMALARMLSRFRLDGLLLVSDGAATDGEPPRYLLDWARNRNLAIYAAGAGVEARESFDLVVLETHCERHNPEAVQAVVGCNGEYAGALRVIFEVDGKHAGEKQIGPAAVTSLNFKLPELAEGWHEYAVRIEKVSGEITELNNLQLGIFQVSPPSRILFVYNAPKLENRHITRFLRGLYEEQMQVLSVRDPELKKFRAQDYLMVIIGDVSPERLPPSLFRALEKKRLVMLVLAGRHLKEWTAARVPGFPVERYVASRNLFLAKQPEGTVRVHPLNRHPVFRHLRLDKLRLNLFDVVTLTESAKVVFAIESGKQSSPLLAADRLDEPRQLVLLSDTTWKWGLHPDPRVRNDYRTFWRVLMNWVIGGPGQEYELAIDFEPNPRREGRTLVKITHPHAETLRGLKNLRLRSRQANMSRTVSPSWRENAWVYDWEDPKTRPAVVWFKASAKSAARELQSIERPRLFKVESQELLDTRAHPERLKALVQKPDIRYAPAGQSQALIKRLLDEFEEPQHHVTVRRRNWHDELTFCVIIVLLLSVEWLVERALKEKTG